VYGKPEYAKTIAEIWRSWSGSERNCRCGEWDVRKISRKGAKALRGPGCEPRRRYEHNVIIEKFDFKFFPSCPLCVVVNMFSWRLSALRETLNGNKLGCDEIILSPKNGKRALVTGLRARMALIWRSCCLRRVTKFTGWCGGRRRSIRGDSIILSGSARGGCAAAAGVRRSGRRVVARPARENDPAR